MKKENLDALKVLYESVYDEEYLNEAPGGPARFWDSNMGRFVANVGRTAGDVRDVLYGDPSGRAAAIARQRLAQRATGKPVTEYPDQRAARISRAQDAAIAAAERAEKAKAKERAATTPATTPARPTVTTPAATSPAARPATPGAGAKVAPTAAARPTSSPATATTAQKIKGGLDVYKSQVKSGDIKGAEATGKSTWALRNPTLAAAQAERDRTRGTSATTNPQMAGLKDRLPAPKSLSPTTASTAFAKPTPALGSSSAPVQSAGSAASAKPTTNQTATTFSSPSLVKPKKPMTQTQSFEWPSAKTIRDIADAYASIYEAKKKDQDQDGDNDFADVQIARMMASGMSKAEAIAAVRNKEYNEEYVTEDPVQDFRDMRRTKENASGVRGPELSHSAVAANSPSTKRQPRSREFSHGGGPTSSAQPRSREFSHGGPTKPTGPSSPGYDTRRLGGSDLRRLSNSYEFEGSIIDKYIGEAAKRTPKKVRGAKNAVEYMKGRSDAGKRISGDEDTGPRHYTLGRARGAAVDAPTPPGAKPKNTPKLAGWEKDDIQYRKANLRAGRTHKVGGEKGLPEEYTVYEIVASYLLENNFAETLNDANVIIENMSETWVAQILESFE